MKLMRYQLTGQQQTIIQKNKLIKNVSNRKTTGIGSKRCYDHSE
jgi:hypothetical protein